MNKQKIRDVLIKLGYESGIKIPETLQGAVWRVSKTPVIKFTNKSLHKHSTAIVNGKAYRVKENILVEQSILKYLSAQKNCPSSIVKFKQFAESNTNYYRLFDMTNGTYGSKYYLTEFKTGRRGESILKFSPYKKKNERCIHVLNDILPEQGIIKRICGHYGHKYFSYKKKNERYDETATYKQQYSSIKIPRDVCDKISNQIKEKIHYLYSHILKSTTLNENNEFIIQNDKTIRIFNCGFHHKITNETLYLVAEPFNQFNYQWKVMKNIFTANDIMNEFNITADKLPNSYDSNSDIKIQLSKQKDIINFTQTPQFYKLVINSTSWNKRDKIPIYNKKNNKNRVTLSLSKQEFLKNLDEATVINANDIIPILMKNNNDNGHHVEYVQILTIQPECDIGIGYIYDKNNQIKVTGIHLDSEFIRSQHQLLFPGDKCDILDYFTCVYDHLTIGNPDLYENNMKRYKNKYQKVSDFMRDSIEYFGKMVSNVANVTVDNIQMWINKARIALKNDKNTDYSLDLSTLYDDKHVSNFEILMKSPLYIKDLQDINNWYFMQTLNTNSPPIIPHEKHKQTHTPIIKPVVVT